MLIIYSRRGEKADDVIKRLADRERERSLIISSDREIMVHAERVGAAVMSAEEFQLPSPVCLCEMMISQKLKKIRLLRAAPKRKARPTEIQKNSDDSVDE